MNYSQVYDTELAAAETHVPALRSGYDLPVYGLAEGRLLVIHVPALCCISVSLCCAIIAVGCSFWTHWHRDGLRFSQWRQGERNVVYLALCDGLFNLFHLFDHIQILMVEDHVRPPWLCQLYAFAIAEFITAQQLLVNAIAVSSFLTVHRLRAVTFGHNDWKLVVYVFGSALALDMLCLCIDGYGPSGSFCYFDGVRGAWQFLAFSTAPFLAVFLVNAVLYALTWRKVRAEESESAAVLGRDGRAAASAARTGLLFVLAFFVQWWPTALYGTWSMVQPAPFIVHQFVTIFVNLGGVFNLVVFFVLVRRRNRRRLALKKCRSGGGGDVCCAGCGDSRTCTCLNISDRERPAGDLLSPTVTVSSSISTTLQSPEANYG